jgi:2-polyprenyl-6-methoxyphenol hydroxylase-like FAD-dependent oxidoreductase
MATPKPFNIAIVGGGITGLTLAIALQQHNIPITIYEAAQHCTFNPAYHSAMPHSLQLAK